MGRYKKDFVLYPRKMKDGREVWYYRCYDAQGHRISGQSTGLTTEKKAEKYCEKLLREGKLIPTKTPTLRAWAEKEKWWQWDKCRYLRGQLDRSDEDKPAVSRRYADDALRDLKAWILPAHGDKRLDEITVEDCEDLLTIWQDKGLSKKSINNKSSIERIMLGEAERLGKIERNPWDRVKRFKPSRHSKGILTLEEARKLLNPATVETVWSGNQVYYSASLLAAVTGMRLGEILALKGSDLFPDHAHVAGSWRGKKYGLGKTKTKRVDDIPIPRFVFDTVDSWRVWEGFVFSFRAGAQPVTGNRVRDALFRALDEIGVKSEERERRNIKFHSWRAFANTYMLARGISGEKVRELIRHESKEMTKLYSDFHLEDFKDVAAAQEALVAGIRAPDVQSEAVK